MKDTIYTIPLTEAFQEQGECPLCFIYKKLEDDAIRFTLGSSYMQSDFREQTNKQGFCSKHYKNLYDYGNRLGVSLILHTHYMELYKSLDYILTNRPDTPKISLINKIKKAPIPKTDINNQISNHIDSCFICDRIEKDFIRYISTFFYLMQKDKEFEQMFENSLGFCVPHFNIALSEAPKYLKAGEEMHKFYMISKTKLLQSLKRIESELDWFIDKHDYNNHDKPWKNSQDVIPRAIQKLSGIYPQADVLKEDI
ncbi:MAG: hypothetical protein ATN35_09170 [Epulopiscium sp. Nele67-Bin004]|nr:MAG: hypothetical protein ATN35_09170 [Epulopiscium sp. Nele67-Bin004]